jgi:hypothetical protein
MPTLSSKILLCVVVKVEASNAAAQARLEAEAKRKL